MHYSGIDTLSNRPSSKLLDPFSLAVDYVLNYKKTSTSQQNGWSQSVLYFGGSNIIIPESDYTSVLCTCIDLLLAWRSTSIVVEEGEGMIDVCADIVDGEVGAAILPLTISIVEGTAMRGMGENLYAQAY